jgi:hypothetical protein
MHFCTAIVSIAGDHDNTVLRGHFNPVSWPETEILRFVHGADAVSDVRVFVDVPQTSADEKARLVSIYGAEPVKEIFPGKNPQMSMTAPDVRALGGIKWKNPLTAHEETTEGDPPDPKEPKPAKKGRADQAELTF